MSNVNVYSDETISYEITIYGTAAQTLVVTKPDGNTVTVTVPTGKVMNGSAVLTLSIEQA